MEEEDGWRRRGEQHEDMTGLRLQYTHTVPTAKMTIADGIL
jgi:hypothetical protein